MGPLPVVLRHHDGDPQTLARPRSGGQVFCSVSKSILVYGRVRTRSGHRGANLPVAVQRLPLTLLRTSRVSRDPREMAEGIQRYERYMEGEPMPPMLPQRMAFQQHKRMGGGLAPGDMRAWWSSAQTLLAAQEESRRAAAVAPIQRPVRRESLALRAQRMGLVSLPQPGARPSQVPAIARRPIDQPSSPPAEAMTVAHRAVGEPVGNVRRGHVNGHFVGAQRGAAFMNYFNV